MKLECAHKHKIPAFVDRNYAAGDKVLVWRETIIQNQICRFISPITVINYDELCKIVLVKNETTDSSSQRLSAAQVVPHIVGEP